MKKFLLLIAFSLTLLVASSFSYTAHAQIRTEQTITAADDTLVNTDTAFVAVSLRGKETSVYAQVTKVSGTVAGKVYLEVSGDGTNYDRTDSLTLANQSNNHKTFALHASNGKKLYYKYRITFYPTGTNVIIPKVYAIRYDD